MSKLARTIFSKEVKKTLDESKSTDGEIKKFQLMTIEHDQGDKWVMLVLKDVKSNEMFKYTAKTHELVQYCPKDSMIPFSYDEESESWDIIYDPDYDWKKDEKFKDYWDKYAKHDHLSGYCTFHEIVESIHGELPYDYLIWS